MFKFFEKKKSLPENPIEPEAPEDKKSINEKMMRDILEVQEAEAKKNEEERKKMRPEVKEMYEKIIAEAKKEGDANKQKVFEGALKEVEKQISRDQEKKKE